MSSSGYGLTDTIDRPELIREDGTRPGERWWPSPGGVGARIVVHVLLLVLVLAIPLMVQDVFQNIIARAVIFAIVALSMNALTGYAGQISLGHAAFVGVGAFTAGIVLTSMKMPYPVALAAAGLTGAVAALLLGGIALRVRGLYLAIVTIAYLLLAQNTLFNIRALTGGGAGQQVPRPSFAASNVPYIYFCYGILALVWLVDWRLTATKAGRAIQAVRDDERVAASWGINITGYKLLAFVISGTVAGVAGALFGAIEEVAVSVTFGLTLSLTFLFMAVVGGLGSRPGVVQGGVVFAVIGTLLERAHHSWGETNCVTPWLSGFGQRIGVLGPEGLQVPIPFVGPRLFQGVVALALVGGAVALAAHWWQRRPWSTGATVARAVGVVAFFGSGVFLGAGMFAPTVSCMFAPLTELWEPFIGALLLVLTLIFFPGGIAQQQEDLLRWLSFKKFHGEAHHGPTGGDFDART